MNYSRLGFNNSGISFCIKVGNDGSGAAACLFEGGVFTAKGSSNSTFKVLPNESWLLLIDLCVSPRLSTQTNPELFLSPGFFLLSQKPFQRFGWPV